MYGLCYFGPYTAAYFIKKAIKLFYQCSLYINTSWKIKSNGKIKDNSLIYLKFIYILLFFQNCFMEYNREALIIIKHITFLSLWIVSLQKVHMKFKTLHSCEGIQVCDSIGAHHVIELLYQCKTSVFSLFVHNTISN